MKPLFDKVLDFAEPILPAFAGAFLMIGVLQYFLPQKPPFYFIVAGLSFVFAVILKFPWELRRIQHGK